MTPTTRDIRESFLTFLETVSTSVDEVESFKERFDDFVTKTKVCFTIIVIDIATLESNH